MSPPQLVYDESERVTLRRAAKKNLWWFIVHVLDGIPIDGASWLHEDVHKPMCDFLQGPETVKDLCGFRGCLKTTLLSGYLVWLTIKHPSISILLASKIDKNSASTINLVKQHWTTNEKLRWLFPELVPKTSGSDARWSDFSARINRQDARRDPTYAACGLGSTVTSQHYNVIILDDAISAEKDKITGEDAAPSIEQIDQAIGFWRMTNNLTVETAKLPSMRINIGTRWAIEDLSDWIRTNEVDVATHDLPVHIDGVPTFPLKGDGSPGWGKAEINKKRKRMGVFMFAGQFMLDPTPKEKMHFRPEWIKKFDPIEVAWIPMNVYVCVDPAISERKGSDFTGIVVVGVSPNDHRWVLDAEQHRIEDPHKVAQRIISLAETYSQLPTTRDLDIVVETQAYQKALKFVVEKGLMERKLYLVVREYPTNQNKVLRIRGLEPIASSGQLHVKRSLDAFLSQLLTWMPLKTKHEHMIDAAAQHLRYAYAPQKETEYAVHPRDMDPMSMERIRWEMRQTAMDEQEDAQWGNPVYAGV